jgi:hypothetical protein
MATAKSPTLLSGKIGTVIFRVRDGKQLAHLAPTAHEEEKFYKRRLKHPLFRFNAMEFAGASRVAGQVYRQLLGGSVSPLVRPYAHNLLTKLLKATGDSHIREALPQRASHYAREYNLYDVWRAFQGLDLSHAGAPARQIRMTPVGPGHNPTAIRVSGVRDAARAIPIGGNARLEVRFHIHQVDFVGQAFSDTFQKWLPTEPGQETRCRRNGIIRPSAWIPVQAMPQDDFVINLPGNPNGDRIITAIAIEWREVRAVGDKEIEHPRQGIVRIAAVHGSAEDFTPRPYTYIPPPDRTVPYGPETVFTPRNDWNHNPREFIEEAMGFMST